MAIIMKCDRCNAIYDPNDLKNVSHYSVMVVHPYTTNETVDLCPTCIKRLNDFMNENEVKEYGRREEM